MLIRLIEVGKPYMKIWAAPLPGLGSWLEERRRLAEHKHSSLSDFLLSYDQ